MQSAAYAAANVVPIYLASSAKAEVHPLVALARHPWHKVDVARELGVSIRTVSRYMREGLPYYKPWPECPPCFEPRAVRTWWAAQGRGSSRGHARRAA